MADFRTGDYGTKYQIHRLVPNEDAIDGINYWTPVWLPNGRCSIEDEDVARKWFNKAPIVPRRLVSVETTVLERLDG